MKACLTFLFLIFFLFSSPFDLFSQEGTGDLHTPSDREKAKTTQEEEPTGESKENLEDAQLRLIQQLTHGKSESAEPEGGGDSEDNPPDDRAEPGD